MTPGQLDSLAALLAEMDAAHAARDVEGWERPHHEFHAALVHPSGPRIERQLALLADHATRYRLAELGPNRHEWEAGTSDHQLLAAAARNGDADAAADALTRHLGRTALVALSLTAPTYEPRRVRRALKHHPAVPATLTTAAPATS
jgi:DNA-binding GntR family transcriptional regulator